MGGNYSWFIARKKPPCWGRKSIFFNWSFWKNLLGGGRKSILCLPKTSLLGRKSVFLMSLFEKHFLVGGNYLLVVLKNLPVGGGKISPGFCCLLEGQLLVWGWMSSCSVATVLLSFLNCLWLKNVFLAVPVFEKTSLLGGGKLSSILFWWFLFSCVGSLLGVGDILVLHLGAGLSLVSPHFSTVFCFFYRVSYRLLQSLKNILP